jgi:hypothetical protein
MPNGRYAAGSSAPQANTMTSTTNKLAHQGERSSTAYNEFWDIFHFINFTRVLSVGGKVEV